MFYGLVATLPYFIEILVCQVLIPIHGFITKVSRIKQQSEG